MQLTNLSDYEINKELNQLAGYQVHESKKENLADSWFSSYMFSNERRLRTGYDYQISEEKAWLQLEDYCNSLSNQFKYAEKHNIKFAVLFSPEPTKDWAVYPDCKFIFMCGEMEEVPSNDLKTGAELLLLVHRETHDNSLNLFNLFEKHKNDNDTLHVQKIKEGYEVFVKDPEGNEHSNKKINKKTYYRLLSLGAKEEILNEE